MRNAHHVCAYSKTVRRYATLDSCPRAGPVRLRPSFFSARMVASFTRTSELGENMPACHRPMMQLLLLRQFMTKLLGRLVHGLVIDAVCWLVM